jgi:hypothetical protein
VRVSWADMDTTDIHDLSIESTEHKPREVQAWILSYSHPTHAPRRSKYRECKNLAVLNSVTALFWRFISSKPDNFLSLDCAHLKRSELSGFSRLCMSNHIADELIISSY